MGRKSQNLTEKRFLIYFSKANYSLNYQIFSYYLSQVFIGRAVMNKKSKR